MLVIISEDPRASHRANEAMRIALGVVAGENEVSIVLAGAAAHLLDEDTDELVDGDDIAKVRASLQEARHPLPRRGRLGPVRRRAGMPTAHPVTPIDAEGIAALAARASRFIVF